MARLTDSTLGDRSQSSEEPYDRSTSGKGK
jgi:hypothetical protein